MSYLGRSSYMLQQGKNIADVLYFYGENTNITWQFKEKLPHIDGYEFDFCNATALKLMQVKNGKIIAPSGATYSLLILDESAKHMTLPVLKKVRDLVKAGAKVAGIKPLKSPSLSDNDGEFQTILKGIWGKNPKLETQNYVEILRGSKVPEDVIITNAKEKVLYIHRKTNVEHIYWLNNRIANTNEAEISFRVSGAVPELWNPQTGKKESVSYTIKDGRTIIPCHFESWGAYFIVFKERANILTYKKPVLTETPIVTISSPWKVNFQEGRGAPQSATFDKLTSWTDYNTVGSNPKSKTQNPKSTEGGIKYFSGTATYQNTFKMDNFDKNAKYEIDLGEVKNIAEVTINGKNIGTLWKTSFKMDTTEGVKAGENSIEIKVTNVWVNRLIGDAQPDVKTKITFTTMPFYRGQEPLLPSGLLSPVRIVLKK